MCSPWSLNNYPSSRAALSKQGFKAHHAGIRHNALVHRASASGESDSEPRHWTCPPQCNHRAGQPDCPQSSEGHWGRGFLQASCG